MTEPKKPPSDIDLLADLLDETLALGERADSPTRPVSAPPPGAVPTYEDPTPLALDDETEERPAGALDLTLGEEEIDPLPEPGETPDADESWRDPGTDSAGEVLELDPGADDAPFADLSLDDEGFDGPEERTVVMPSPVSSPAVEEVVLDEVADEDLSFVETEDEPDEAFLIEGGEEEIVLDLRDEGPDRGAILAESVTSRARHFKPGDRMYAADARAEARGRADLLMEEAEYATTPARAAEMLALAADLLDCVLDEGARARELLVEARERAPEVLLATRSLRRMELAAGNLDAVVALCDEEAGGDLTEAERRELAVFVAEVEARAGGPDVEARWAEVARAGGVTAAVAKLFSVATRPEPSALGDALAALAGSTSGALAAAANVARGRLAEGAAEQDTALAAIEEAVRRDPTDVGAWLALARIGFARAGSGIFREALAGIGRAGGGGVARVVEGGVTRALDALLGAPVAPGHVEDTGVAGWLAARALRDSGGDSGPQVEYGIRHATGAERQAWAAWREGGSPDGEVGRYFALRRASQTGDDEVIAAAAADLVDSGGASAVRAGLLARRGDVADGEVRPLVSADDPRTAVLRAGLTASTRGFNMAEALAAGTSARGYLDLAGAEAVLRDGLRDEAIARYRALAGGDYPPGVSTYAAREVAALARALSAWVTALRDEARGAKDERRAAGLRFLAAAVAAGADVPGGADDALGASRTLAGDLAAAELAALYALRGELDPAAGADALAGAARGEGLAERMAAVRSALRRASVDVDAAGATLADVWQRAEGDAPLGVLVLRAGAGDPAREGAVLRAQAERAQGPAHGVAAWMLLASVLSQAGRHADAVQAIARARAFGFGAADPALDAAEERSWLRAGMFAEVAERALDQLRSAADDARRVAAYEKLAELDSTFRGDVASAVLSFHAILEIAPSHMASLRTLERHFLEQGRNDELLDVYERLIAHLAAPADVIAVAHGAARLAALQAEGDVTAGVRFLHAAFDRGAADGRLVMALDAECRRTGDLARFAEVHARGVEVEGDPPERATHAARAAEALLALGGTDRAREMFERAVEIDPRHPTALAGAARTREAAGAHARSAEALDALGALLRAPEHAADAFFRAGVAFAERVGDPARARTAFAEVLARAPDHPNAFERMVRALRDSGDREGELAAIERRLAAGGSTRAAEAALRARAAELAGMSGDATRAKEYWREVVRSDPERPDALRALWRLSVDDGDFRAAAEAMVRLARVTTDAAERVELFLELGDLFDRHLGDPQRAEAAFRRVTQLAPGDVRALRRMADLYARTGDAAREAEVLASLAAQDITAEERVALRLRLARVFAEGVGDAQRAQEALELARREAPADLGVLRAIVEFHEQRGDRAAAEALLDRAAAEVRRETDRNPTDARSLGRLADVLELRGLADGARVVGAVAAALGVDDERLVALAPRGVVPGAQGAALARGAVDLLSPPSITNPLRQMLARTGDVLDRLLPPDPEAWRMDRLGARPHPLRGEIERWAGVLELGPVEIHLGTDLPSLCVPLSSSPAAVVVPAGASVTPASRFAVARALLLAALSLPLAVRLPPGELSLALAAVLRQFDPMYRTGAVDVARLEDLTRQVARAMPKERLAEVKPFAHEVIGRQGVDGEAVRAGALELGDRLALLATGDFVGAIAALSPEGVPAARAVVEVPAVARLVRVALSDRFLEACRAAGIDRRGEEG